MEVVTFMIDVVSRRGVVSGRGARQRGRGGPAREGRGGGRVRGGGGRAQRGGRQRGGGGRGHPCACAARRGGQAEWTAAQLWVD